MSLGAFVDDAGRRRFEAAYREAAATMPPGEERALPTSLGSVHAYDLRGEGGDADLPLVLLPGRNAAAPSWSPALPALLDLGRRVVVLDAVGEAGRSRQSAPLRTPVEHATWVAEAVDGLGLGRVHLVATAWAGGRPSRSRVSAPTSWRP